MITIEEPLAYAPTKSAPSTRPANAVALHRGMTFGFYARNGYYGSAEARREVDRMATLNIEWICLVVTVLQDTFASTRQYRDFKQTPADDELRDIIDYIHSRGLKVQLRPMLECWDGAQRIQITFPNEVEIIPGKPMTHWTRWFDSMVERTLHYAALAQRAGCEAYGLDSELDHTIHQQTHWLRVIAAARSVYHGHLTTGHTRIVDFVKELREHPDHWFRQLDSLGSSFYSPLGDGPDTTEEEMLARIQPDVAYYREAAALLGKPFYFAECGCCSTTGSIAKPFGWDNPGGYDGEGQARFLETILRAFWQEPWWMGLYWWKWEEQNDRPWLRDDPRGDKGFPVWQKPAANIMRRWYARPHS
ncbi:glycoside hydrolase family 113 [Geminisphaera colitermitum]|uniref:glycoside hydrolase family 113 n=1 Tax=Geminisphaera colitermitum TaxID=1148786 RepID=UPI0006947F6E|nr:hypothetical protein [Geminisphaera colitermitum]